MRNKSVLYLVISLSFASCSKDKKVEFKDKTIESVVRQTQELNGDITINDLAEI